MELAEMKAAVEQIRTTFAFSERRACGLIRLPVNTFRYHRTERNAELRERLIEIAREKPRFGYRRLHVLLNRDGLQVNHKRVWRVYQEAGLAMKKVKRRRLIREGKPLTPVTAANEEWALDFVSDAIQSGRHIRLLAVVDAYTRECFALEVDTSFASRRATGVLDRVIAERGRPGRIRCDNGAEFTSRHFLAWAIENRIELLHIQPGRPMQNGRVESFNGKMRAEFLNTSWFSNLFDARTKAAAWRREYNEERPHSSLGYRTPLQFARGLNSVTSPSSVCGTAVSDRRKGFPHGSLRSALTPVLRRGLVAGQEGEVTY